MSGGDGLTRRQWLSQVAAGSAVLVGACEGGGGAGADAASAGDAAGSGGDAPNPGPADIPAEDAGQGDAPPRVEAPDGGEPRAPGLTPLRGDGSHPFHYVDTVVIVQMENRSFDHVFGSLSLVEGRTDVEGLLPGMTNPTLAGKPVGVRELTDAWVVHPDPPHGRSACLAQWNDGKNDGFVRKWEPALDADELDRLDWVMGYYTRAQLPVHYALADAFTLCDRWHASLLSSTWPNRYHSHCATSGGIIDNSSACDAPTIYPLVEASGLTYGCYYKDLYFMLTLNALPFEKHNTRPSHQFFEDAKAGTLPNVTILEPSFNFNDDHPPADVRQGQIFLSSVYEALRQSPHWDRCLLVIFYDEHGGFHDHVAPPTAAGEPLAAQGLAQLGFRVPGLVVGPLVARGGVLHTVLEHSSVPSLISNVFGLEHLNERSRLAGDIGGALTLDLVPDAARPVAPAMPPVEITEEALFRALEMPCGQPELQALAQRRGIRLLTDRQRHLNAMRFFAHAERLGSLRVR